MNGWGDIRIWGDDSSSSSSRRMNVPAEPADECGNIIDGTEMEGAIICGGWGGGGIIDAWFCFFNSSFCNALLDIFNMQLQLQ